MFSKPNERCFESSDYYLCVRRRERLVVPVAMLLVFLENWERPEITKMGEKSSKNFGDRCYAVIAENGSSNTYFE